MQLVIGILAAAIILTGSGVLINILKCRIRKEYSASFPKSTSEKSGLFETNILANIQTPEKAKDMYLNNHTQKKTTGELETDNASESLTRVDGTLLTTRHSVRNSSHYTITPKKNENYQTEETLPYAEKKEAMPKALPIEEQSVSNLNKTMNSREKKEEESEEETSFDEPETTNLLFKGSLGCFKQHKCLLYDKFFVFLKAVFNYPDDLDTFVIALYYSLEEKETKTINQVGNCLLTWEQQDSLKKLLEKDISQILNFYFIKSEFRLNHIDPDINKSVLKKSFANTLNLIRASEQYKSKLRSKKGSQEIQIKLFDDDNIESKEKINFKIPVKHKGQLYRFDSLNLIMNNEPMKNYILQTIEKDSAKKLKEIIEKQFDLLTDTDFEYIKTFKNFDGEPLDFFKELLIIKRRPELQKHKQLYMGEIEYSILDQTKNTFQFKYNQITVQHGKVDNETPELPLMSIIMEELIIEEYRDNVISIQETILGCQYQTYPATEYDILNYKKMSFFLNQFPFLIFKIKKKPKQRNDNTLKLICEKKLIIPEINEGLNEYKLTGFMMENKELADKSESYLECFNICNDEIQAVSRTKKDYNTLKMAVPETETKEPVICFYFKKDSILKIRYLLYKKISKSFSNKEETEQ
ncbi:hypothetical protein CDIK_3046 [Cucumispora dikerogammari]|nr:hypothetical protein CDIK_3046 [Cucumispora dikerogammari]